MNFSSRETSFSTLVARARFAIFEYNAHPDFFFDILNGLENSSCLKLYDILILFGENPRLEYKDRISRNREQSKDQLHYDWPIEHYAITWTHKYENSLIKILDQFSLGLRRHNPTYESVYDCVPSLLTFETWNFSSRGGVSKSICDFIFPIEATIERCTIEGTHFQTLVKFHRDLNPKHLRLGIIARGMDKTQRTQIKFNVKRKKTKQILRTTSIKRSIKGVADVQTYLFLENGLSYLDQRKVRNIRSELNLRLLIHYVFDTNDRFSQDLYVEKLRTQNFEWAVTTLLHFCGFQTEQIGSQGLGPTPDILAFHPAKDSILVGECDTGVPDQTKILNLMRRVEIIEERFQGTILPVLFSAEKDGLLSEISVHAHAREVAVIGIDSLEKILLAASRGENLDAICQLLGSIGIIPTILPTNQFSMR